MLSIISSSGEILTDLMAPSVIPHSLSKGDGELDSIAPVAASSSSRTAYALLSRAIGFGNQMSRFVYVAHQRVSFVKMH